MLQCREEWRPCLSILSLSLSLDLTSRRSEEQMFNLRTSRNEPNEVTVCSVSLFPFSLSSFFFRFFLSLSVLQRQPEGEFYPTTIYVGDLPNGTDEQDLERAFARFGPIETIRLLPGKKSVLLSLSVSLVCVCVCLCLHL